jgi:putative addiction module killer protein
METSSKKLINYETESGQVPFREWLLALRDKVTVARIRARLERVELGNFGDSKSVGNGISELRFTFGSGFRVYYAEDGDQIVILLIGGDKSTQEKDIQLACKYWADYTRRIQNDKNN